MESVTIKIISATFSNGDPVEIDQIIETTEDNARALISMNKAIRVESNSKKKGKNKDKEPKRTHSFNDEETKIQVEEEDL
tara:strand:- start:5108 stop:5347 length:240 start_codon:yes stop_codon:yes gene_type:complete